MRRTNDSTNALLCLAHPPGLALGSSISNKPVRLQKIYSRRMPSPRRSPRHATSPAAITSPTTAKSSPGSRSSPRLAERNAAAKQAAEQVGVHTPARSPHWVRSTERDGTRDGPSVRKHDAQPKQVDSH